MTLSPDDRDALAERGAAGDRDAAGATIEAVRPLVLLVVRRMRIPRRLREEIEVDALAEVALRLPRYDRRKASFATFAGNVARWYVLGLRRQATAGPRFVPLAAPPGDPEGPRDSPDPSAVDPAEAAADRIDRADAWGRLDSLPERERRAVTAWACGAPAADTAAELRVSRSRVGQLRDAGVRRLRRGR